MSELVGHAPDPAQPAKGAADKGARSDLATSEEEEDLPALRVSTGETELLSDIFGLDLRREGGQYKLTPHDPNASLTELLASPFPVPDASAATAAELQCNKQVSLWFYFSVICAEIKQMRVRMLVA